MFHILVVEDDPHARKLMQTVLEQNGYSVYTAKDGLDALAVIDQKHIDLVVLDVMMPRMDGYEFTKEIRDGGSDLPILMVTARETPSDVKRGFIIGTDDYMTKPVDEEEMLLRIAALLRRSRIVSEKKLTVGDTVLDYSSYTVSAGGKRYELPQKEFLLLFKLLSYQNKIYIRRQLMDEIWDMDSASDERTVDVHINRLRDKFRDSPDFQIITMRGLGYKAVAK